MTAPLAAVPTSAPTSSLITSCHVPFWPVENPPSVVTVGVIVVPQAEAVKVPSGRKVPVKGGAPAVILIAAASSKMVLV